MNPALMGRASRICRMDRARGASSPLAPTELPWGPLRFRGGRLGEPATAWPLRSIGVPRL